MSNTITDFQNYIKNQLVKEKNRLVSDLNQLESQDPFANPDRLNDNAASDMEATEESDHDRVVAVIEEIKKKINDIEETLLTIENGAYGICTNCKKEIDLNRLKALPTAKFCVNCLEKK